MKQKIGIDTDGVIFNLFLFQIENGIKHFKKLNKDINIDGYNVDSILECKPKVRQEFWIKYVEEYNKNTEDKINIEKYDIKDIFNCNHNERQEFWIKNIYKYCMHAELVDGTVEMMKKWHSEGHELYNITARVYVDKSNPLGTFFRYLLRRRYEIEGIEFDGIDYCSEKESVRDKTIACNKRQIDFMLEDRTDNIKSIIENTNAKVICFDYPYNSDYNDEYQMHVTDFFQSDNIIQSVEIEQGEIPEKNYMVNGKFKKLSQEKEMILSDSELIDYYKQLKNYYKKLPFDYENTKKYEEMIEYIQLSIYEKFKKLGNFNYHNDRDFESLKELFEYISYIRKVKSKVKNEEIKLKQDFYRKWPYQYHKIEEHERNFMKYYTKVMPIFNLCFKPTILNKELIPYQDGLIFVSNHLSYWDQFPMLCAIGNRPIHFLAASELLEKKIRGPLYEKTGCVFIDRKSHKSQYNSFNILAKILANNGNIAMFPEGTRNLKERITPYPTNILDLSNSRNEYRYLLEFHHGCLQLAQMTGSPIVPIATNGTNEKYTLNFNRDKLLVRVGQPMLVRPKDDLKEKNEELMQTIRDMIWYNLEYERVNSKNPCLYQGIESSDSKGSIDMEIENMRDQSNSEILRLPEKIAIGLQTIEKSNLQIIKEEGFQKKLKKVAR